VRCPRRVRVQWPPWLAGPCPRQRQLHDTRVSTHSVPHCIERMRHSALDTRNSGNTWQLCPSNTLLVSTRDSMVPSLTVGYIACIAAHRIAQECPYVTYSSAGPQAPGPGSASSERA
jgi:hypothetical protein